METDPNPFAARRDLLRELAERYVLSTERYDRLICRAPQVFHGNDVMPVHPADRALCTRNAEARLREASLTAVRLGFTPDDLKSLIKRIPTPPRG